MIKAQKRSKYGECAKVVAQWLKLSALNSKVPGSWGGEKVSNFEFYHFMSRNNIVFAVIAPGFSGV